MIPPLISDFPLFHGLCILDNDIGAPDETDCITALSPRFALREGSDLNIDYSANRCGILFPVSLT
jgi:hypothetical protein